MLTVRHAVPSDLSAIAALEAACFPPSEAATKEVLSARLAVYPNHFWLLFDTGIQDGEGREPTESPGRLVSFVDGFCTDTADLADWMYADASGHREQGRWQMIFGVNTHPDCRRRGYAGMLLRIAVEESHLTGKAGLVLTCKQALIPYYSSFGFIDEGLSSSVHGAAVWHQMRLTF